jgi:hypothetical protein
MFAWNVDSCVGRFKKGANLNLVGRPLNRRGPSCHQRLRTSKNAERPGFLRRAGTPGAMVLDGSPGPLAAPAWGMAHGAMGMAMGDGRTNRLGLARQPA